MIIIIIIIIIVVIVIAIKQLRFHLHFQMTPRGALGQETANLNTTLSSSYLVNICIDMPGSRGKRTEVGYISMLD